MAFHYSPKIVTDDLVFVLDAGNPKSYSGTGTAWNDLSGNSNHMTLTGSPVFNPANNGSITFDGTDDYAAIGGNNIPSTNPLSLYGITNFSIEVLVNGNGTGNANQHILAKGDPIGLVGWALTYGDPATADELGFFISETEVVGNATSGTLTGITDFGNWAHYTVTKSGTTFKLYKNGVLFDTTTDSTAVVSTTHDFKVGKPHHSEDHELNGNVAIARVYHKALTQSEIIQNFNATKSRFGL